MVADSRRNDWNLEYEIRRDKEGEECDEKKLRGWILVLDALVTATREWARSGSGNTEVDERGYRVVYHTDSLDFD